MLGHEIKSETGVSTPLMEASHHAFVPYTVIALEGKNRTSFWSAFCIVTIF